jgi:hypothetical protein
MTIGDLIRDMLYLGLERFGLYYATYRAFVMDVEDPLHLGRVKLKIPEIAKNAIIDYWAFPKSFSGPGYGIQNIPEKGDMVWVTFELGSPRRPIWEHGHFGKNEPPSIERLKSYNNRWLRTKAGHTIEVDDKEELIRITNLSDFNILIKKDKIYLLSELSNANAQPILLGDETIKQVQQLSDNLDTFFNAVNVAVPTPSDGGAAIQTTLKAAITTLTPVDFSNCKSTTSKTD